MSEQQNGGTSGGDPGSLGYSKDYWDDVFAQIKKSPLVKLAICVLVLLYATAIYAPLIANDRPYYLNAINKKEYKSARRSLVGVTNSMIELVDKGRETFTSERDAAGRTEQSYDGALRAESEALTHRLDTMRRYIDESLHAPLNDLDGKVSALADAATAGDRATALALSETTLSAAKSVRSSYKAKNADKPGAGDIALRPVRSFPLFTSTTGIEIFFGVLWLFILTWPIWNHLVNARWLGSDRERIRDARRKKVRVAFGAATVAAVLWSAFIGGSMVFEKALFKDAIDKGDLELQVAIFPPFTIGFAETHIEEMYRPPTWTPNSAINTAGFYIQGPRVPLPDPVTGRMPTTQPVDVRHGEPGRNNAFRHLLGTDQLGRDLFVRLLYGGRISLSVGLISTVLLITIGVFVGAIAGYVGGRTDILLSRLIEIVQCFPAFFLIITAVSLIPEKTMHPIFTIIFLIAIVRWTGVARLVRGEFLRLKEQDFVLAAEAVGVKPLRVVFRHILPNALGPVLVAAAFSIAAGILTESAISFLGLGIKHPIPSWGSLINESRAAEHWWIQIFPGLLIFITVFCYNLIGEGVRDALDPRMKA